MISIPNPQMSSGNKKIPGENSNIYNMTLLCLNGIRIINYEHITFYPLQRILEIILKKD